MQHIENTIISWTFESKFGVIDWTCSVGRWDNRKDAAKAAANWFVICEENDYTCEIRIIEVREISFT